MTDLLTADEREAMVLTVNLTDVLHRVVGDGSSRGGDLRELLGHIHGIQQAVLSQAAARAYPDDFRLLGQTIEGRED